MQYGFKGMLLAIGAIITCSIIGIYFIYIRQSKPLASKGNTTIEDVNQIIETSDVKRYTTERINGAQVAIAIERLRYDYDVVVQINTETKQIDYKVLDNDDNGVRLTFTADLDSSDVLKEHLDWNSTEWINPTAEFQGRFLDKKGPNGKADGVEDTIVFTQMSAYTAPDFVAGEALADITTEIAAVQEALTKLRIQVNSMTGLYDKWSAVTTDLDTKAETAYRNYSKLLELEGSADEKGKQSLDEAFKKNGVFPWSSLTLGDTATNSTTGVTVGETYSNFIGVKYDTLTLVNGQAPKAVAWSQVKAQDAETYGSYAYFRNNVAVKCTAGAETFGFLNGASQLYVLETDNSEFVLTGRYKTVSELGKRITGFLNPNITVKKDNSIVFTDVELEGGGSKDVEFTQLQVLYNNVENNINYAINMATHLDKDQSSFERQKETTCDYIKKAIEGIKAIRGTVYSDTVSVDDEDTASNPAYTIQLYNVNNVLSDNNRFNPNLITALQEFSGNTTLSGKNGYTEITELYEAAVDYNSKAATIKSLASDFNAELSQLAGTSVNDGTSLLAKLEQALNTAYSAIDSLI